MAPYKYSYTKALLWILLSNFLVAALFFLSFSNASYERLKNAADPKFNIHYLMQTGPEKEQLKTEYLAELLSLSQDEPVNVYQYPILEAQNKILKNPLFKTVSIKRVSPDTLLIDYTIRKPIAFLYNRSNTALDSEGKLFPFSPFYTPKKLPWIYLNEALFFKNEAIWGKNLTFGEDKLKPISLFNEIKKYALQFDLNLSSVDFSKIEESIFAKREIVLMATTNISYKNDPQKLFFIRLPVYDLKEAFEKLGSLKKYLQMRERDKKSIYILDLRQKELVLFKKVGGGNLPSGF